MDYEKRYKEALERAKAMIKVATNQNEVIGFVNTIFPELVESEDEKTRKELIAFLEELSKLGKNTNFDKWKTSDCANWIAWLEKQREITQVNKVSKVFSINPYEYWNSPTFIANVIQHLGTKENKQQLNAYKKLLANGIIWKKTDVTTIKTLIKGFQHYYPHEQFAGVDVREILLYLELLKLRLDSLEDI